MASDQEREPVPMDDATRGYSIDALSGEVQYLRHLASSYPSRELSLAITNAEQAVHWLEKVPVQE